MVDINITIIFWNIILIVPFLFPHVVIISCLAHTDDADHLHCEEECYNPMDIHGHQEKMFHPTYKWLAYNWHNLLQFYLDTSSAADGLLLVINELPCLYSTQFEIWNLKFENWILNFQNCLLYKEACSKISSNSSTAALKVSR